MANLIVKTDCRLHQYNTSNETLTLEDYASFEASSTAPLAIANWDDYKEAKHMSFMCYLNKPTKLQSHRYYYAITSFFDAHQPKEVTQDD